MAGSPRLLRAGHRPGTGRQRPPRVGGGLGLIARLPAGLGLLVLTHFAGGDLAAQQLAAARMQIEHGADGVTSVSMAYTVTPDTATAVPVSWLEIAATTVADVVVAVDGQPARVAIESTTGSRTVAAIQLPVVAHDSVRMTLSYRVRGAAHDRGGHVLHRVPTVAVLWPAANPSLATFQAVVIAEPGRSIYDPFPSSGVSEVRDGAARRRFDLQVVPAFVRYSTVDGPPPLASLPRVIDAVALITFALLAVIGIQRFRRPQ